MVRPNSLNEKVVRLFKRACVLVVGARSGFAAIAGRSQGLKQLGFDSLLKKVFGHWGGRMPVV
jgi:hypothetical protein